jgi:hypothetical protein
MLLYHYRKEVRKMINPILTNKYESAILDLVEKYDQITTSDLQGIVAVLVNKIMEAGYEIISKQNLDNKEKEDRVYKIYEALDDNEKSGIQFGLFPIKVQELAIEYKIDQHEIVVSLMKLDQEVREKRGERTINSKN